MLIGGKHLDKYTALKRYFGFSKFRDGQEKIIDALLDRKDVLAVMPTGGGKSLCFQLPALMLSGTAIVISPLISLMKDQITALSENGISAQTLNSSLSRDEFKRICRSAFCGKYKLLYVSPERLNSQDFLSLTKRLNISLICVDEAHCISHWGQDFRSSYLEIADFIASLEKRPAVAAFTATATKPVRDDICRLLRLINPEITITGFDRKNLFFEVLKPDDKFTALRKCLDSHISKSSIVYCSTRKTVSEVCERLICAGYSAARYHAGLTSEERKHNQELFLKDRVKIMVATNAFGMGIDKSDVSLVVHYNMPGDIESYYQEAGRAGRDGSAADCILLYSPQDIFTQKFFINNPPENANMSEGEKVLFKRRKTRMLKSMIEYCQSQTCLRGYILGYFGEKTDKRCNNCSVCTGEKNYIDITVDSQKVLSAVFRGKGAFTREEIRSILLGEDNAEKTFSKIKTFSAMSGSSAEFIDKVTDKLIESGFLSVCGSENGARLVNTPQASGVLFGSVRVQMETFSEKSVNAVKKPAAKYKTDLLLFTMLKLVRKNIAERLSLPPLAVFTDSVLREMSEKKPLTISDMRKISGMSEKKLEKYAPVFLREISNYVKKEPQHK